MIGKRPFVMLPSATFLCLLLAAFTRGQLPALPAGPLEFHVEAFISNSNPSTNEKKQYVASFSEYHDTTGGRVYSRQISNNMETRSYISTEVSQSFVVTRDLTTTSLEDAVCVTQNISADAIRAGSISITHVGQQVVIQNITKYFSYGSTETLQSSGTGEIRGIPAKQWITSERNSARGYDVNITYWFSDNYRMPYFGTDPVPLRIEVKGTFTPRVTGALPNTMNHVYDFFSVAPISPGKYDDNLYSTPRGVFCPGRRAPSRLSADFNPEEYSSREETVYSKEKVVIQSSTYFDRRLGMSRVDLRFVESPMNPTSATWFKQYGNASLRIYHDFRQNVEVIVNVDAGTCTVGPLVNSSLSWDRDIQGNQATMVDSVLKKWYNNATYHGKRNVRGLPVEVWSIKSVSDSINSTSEFYKLQDGWTLASGSNTSESNTLTGYYTRVISTGPSLVDEITVNAYDAFTGTLDPSIFLAADCVNPNGEHKEHLAFRISDPQRFYNREKVGEAQMTRAMRDFIATAAQVSPTRVGNVEIFQEDDASGILILKVFFILFSPLSTRGTVPSNLPIDIPVKDMIIDPANVEATTKMELYLTQGLSQGGRPIQVPLIGGGTGTMLVQSLLYQDDGQLLGGKDKNLNEKTQKTYTSAAMAGLGIGMLLLGALLAVAAGVVVWMKRFDLNLPYGKQENSS